MNSASVDIKFTEPRLAQKFYFNAPGEGYCGKHHVHKCVEGNARRAQRLVAMARRARGVTTINVSEYHVS